MGRLARCSGSSQPDVPTRSCIHLSTLLRRQVSSYKPNGHDERHETGQGVRSIRQNTIAGHVVLDLSNLANDVLAFRNLFLYDGNLLFRLGWEGNPEVMVATVDVVNDPGEDDWPSLQDGLKPDQQK